MNPITADQGDIPTELFGSSPTTRSSSSRRPRSAKP